MNILTLCPTKNLTDYLPGAQQSSNFHKTDEIPGATILNVQIWPEESREFSEQVAAMSPKTHGLCKHYSIWGWPRTSLWNPMECICLACRQTLPEISHCSAASLIMPQTQLYWKISHLNTWDTKRREPVCTHVISSTYMVTEHSLILEQNGRGFFPPEITSFSFIWVLEYSW